MASNQEPKVHHFQVSKTTQIRQDFLAQVEVLAKQINANQNYLQYIAIQSPGKSVRCSDVKGDST